MNLVRDNVRAFVDLIQGFKEQENIAIKVKGKKIVSSDFSSRHIGTGQLHDRFRIH